MDAHMIIEMTGYIGSALVLVSFLMPSVVKLRVINTAGSFISVMYALIIKAYPTAVMNICLVGINIYYLFRINKRDGRHFDMIKVSPDDTYLTYLLNYYRADIKKHFPEWNEDMSCIDMAAIVFCDTVPAGMFLGRKCNEICLDMVFEYAVLAYRDCSVGGAYIMSCQEWEYAS